MAVNIQPEMRKCSCSVLVLVGFEEFGNKKLNILFRGRIKM